MTGDQSFELSGNDIQIWTLPTQASNEVVAKFDQILAPEESDRAARFHFAHLRESFVIAHGALRILLGKYSNIRPADIRFVYGSKGKPALAEANAIDFNLSHSGTLAVVAITTNCPIGVDIEEIRPVSDMQEIAKRFFCPEEANEVLSLPLDERERAFFCCWTRKEAYIKAIGDGLSTPLDSFCVTAKPDSPARFVHIAHDPAAVEAWMLHDLRLRQGYAAALAYRDRQRSLLIQPIFELRELVGLS